MRETRRWGEAMFRIFGTIFIVLGLLVVWNLAKKPKTKALPWKGDTVHCFVIEKEGK